MKVEVKEYRVVKNNNIRNIKKVYKFIYRLFGQCGGT